MRDEAEKTREHRSRSSAQAIDRGAIRDAIAQDDALLATLEAQRDESGHRLTALRAELAAFDAEPVVVLQGGMSASARREAKRQLAVITDADERVVIATGRYIGEGFDDARLDALFLALPVSWRGTLIQYAGRRLCYARGEAPLGLGDAGDDLVVEYDEGALRALKERDDFI